MSATTLYAWERPLTQNETPVISNLDHTWVPNYPVTVDPAHQQDPPRGWKPPASYWYCWGSPHDIASHALGSAGGSLNTANGISPCNVTATQSGAEQYSPSSTSGAIVYYGLDGVCHNVANEVLCATGSATEEPIRVRHARGYPLSTFFFGTYGLNSEAWEGIREKYAPGIKLAGDDFLPFMERHVPIQSQPELLDIRKDAQKRIKALRTRVAQKDFDFYPELAVIVAETLYRARKLLGHHVFYQLFPALEIDDTTWLKALL